MKKRITILLFTMSFVLLVFGQGKPKYIFYFIGDGMGLSQINITEMYLAEIEGQTGIKPLLFTQFPVAGIATTFSSSHGVTDSAAAGTALATGSKTINGTISMDSTFNNKMESVASKAKVAGKKVGIVTTCSLDDATPAAFYAHQPKRSMGYEIALDAIESQFDFFGGATFSKPDIRYDKTAAPNAFELMEKAGYKLLYGYTDYKKNKGDARKIILMEEKGSGMFDLAYALDQKDNNLTLCQLTEAAIETLKDSPNGFFLMVEGGIIDVACHANDAGTTIREVIDLDNAVKIAYDFYLQYPDETLIIVTADHETGGMVLGTGSSRLNLQALQYQKMSQSALSTRIAELRKRKNGQVSWDEIKILLSDALGLWDKVPVTESQEKIIYEAYENSFIRGDTTKEKTLYQEDEKIAATARKILNNIAMVGWTSTNHSASHVPVFAIGVGAERFGNKMDNTDIPKRIIEVGGY